jgi:hypothetical protein
MGFREHVSEAALRQVAIVSFGCERGRLGDLALHVRRRRKPALEGSG